MQPINTSSSSGSQPEALYDVEDAGENDVLFGRGTGSNMHSGNIRFRALIQKYKPIYRDTAKKLKPSVSTKVVAIWRAQNPPGRFLTRSDRFNGNKRTFYDVGDATARRKAAQCLREKASRERVGLTVADKSTAATKPTSEKSSKKKEESGKSAQEEGPQEKAQKPVATESTGGFSPEVEALHRVFGILEEDAKSAEFASSSFIRDSTAKAELSSDINMMFPSLNLKDMVQIGTNKLKHSSAESMPFSLIGVMGSHQTDREDSNSPFTMSELDFGDEEEEDQGGLCFPSLEGVSSSFPSLGSGGGMSAFDLSVQNETAPDEIKSDYMLHMRNSLPTAASLLTTNLFDD